MNFNDLSSIQTQSFINLRQAYDAWLSVNSDVGRRFSGSMRWKESNNTEYLARKIGSSEKSLGRRSPATEHIYDAFMNVRQAAQNRLQKLGSALDIQAAIARSVGLGRVPVLVARILRKLDQAQVLGHIRVVGTNALYAYESIAGAHFSGDAMTTRDIDVLVDARHCLRIILPDKIQRSILGLLRRLDQTFAPISGKSYSVVNDDGFMVDLICQETMSPLKKQASLTPLGSNDLLPVSIDGLQWLVNCAALRTLVVDERGHPAPIVTPEPRIWLLHKIWLSQQPMRDHGHRRRDFEQAQALYQLVSRNLPQFPFDDDFIRALPSPLRRVLADMPVHLGVHQDDNEEWVMPTPRW